MQQIQKIATMIKNKNIPATFTDSQQKALRLLKEGKNIFLTGKAGTGKSFLTREFIRMNFGKNILVCAPTGIAALNVGGSTIHRAFRAPIGIIEPNARCLYKENMRLIDKAEIILIDEISMCRADLFGFVARTIMASKRKKQIVCVGDFYQLPPVLAEKDAKAYKRLYGESLYAFESPYWSQIGLQTVELQEVVRQKETSFVNALTRIRAGVPDFGVFKQGQKPLRGAVTVTSTRDKAKAINDSHMNALKKGISCVYNAVVEGSVTSADKVTEDKLILAPDARVMMLNNDKEGRWVNGSLGTVIKCYDDHFVVNIDGVKSNYDVEPYTWKVIEYYIDEEVVKEPKLRQREIGSFTQYPVKLAWAITIHKSQGQTYEKVNVDASNGFFERGMMYVALSRCSSLKGLRILGNLREKDLICSPDVRKFMGIKESSVENAKENLKQLSILDVLNKAKAIYITLPSSMIDQAQGLMKSMPNVGIIIDETGEVIKAVDGYSPMTAMSPKNFIEPKHEIKEKVEASKHELSVEQRQERAEIRAKNKAKVEEQKKKIEQRNSTLMPETREALAGLSDRDNVVFWTIRDTGTNGIDAKDIPERTGQSTRSIARSISTLQKNNLVILEGSKKTGKFKAIGDAAKDSRCMTCKLREQCQGNSLLCGSYEPIS